MASRRLEVADAVALPPSTLGRFNHKHLYISSSGMFYDNTVTEYHYYKQFFSPATSLHRGSQVPAVWHWFHRVWQVGSTF